jgi:HK97 family phage portal protein
MPNFLQKTVHAIKSIWISDFDSRTSARFGYTVGSAINWDSITGEFWRNSTALACYLWIAKNVTQAPPRVLRPDADGEMQVVPAHPLATRLTRPNPFHSGAELMYGVLLSLLADGNAYIGIETNGAGQIAELKWLPHRYVTPRRLPGSWNLIDYYEYSGLGGTPDILQRDQVIHIRMGLDPDDPALGLSGWKALKRQGYTLDQVVNYTANIMRNHGAIGGLATNASTNAPGGGGVDFDPKEFTRMWHEKHGGDKVGGMMAVNADIKLQFPKNSPQEMAIDTIPDRPESDICAVIGVPPAVIHVLVSRLDKTRANAGEARQQGWEETCCPLLNLIASQIAFDLLPRMPGYLPGDVLEYDVTKIRPLQPDLDKLHARALADWLANLYDRATWKSIVGLKVLPEDKGVYYRDVAVQGVAETLTAKDKQSTKLDEAQKALKSLLDDDPDFENVPVDWSARVDAELQLMLHGASA